MPDRRERGCECKDGIKHDIEHQNGPAAETVGEAAEQKCSKGPQCQSHEKRKRDGLHIDREFPRDFRNDKDEEKIVEGVQRPAEITRGNGVFLRSCPAAELFKHR